MTKLKYKLVCVTRVDFIQLTICENIIAIGIECIYTNWESEIYVMLHMFPVIVRHLCLTHYLNIAQYSH